MGEITRIVKLETVLHGGNGGGGLVGKIDATDKKRDKEHTAVIDRIRKLELGNARLIGTVGGVAGLISGIVVALAVKFLGG